ncbi:hypothetical protein BJ138DRAFT_1103088 [Hygrophoropsis aurantiaca]|uniref:Uncharacterized protein n=1 Tax=Hygrophoropsis aurantiaca TaxID=72124 RepID=A0ACB8A7A3_9AGAM|nr:hypothetical protein BJ138DRAFT_1103088 [Hygrophoropsis aurantiaca]
MSLCMASEKLVAQSCWEATYDAMSARHSQSSELHMNVTSADFIPEDGSSPGTQFDNLVPIHHHGHMAEIELKEKKHATSMYLCKAREIAVGSIELHRTKFGGMQTTTKMASMRCTLPIMVKELSKLAVGVDFEGNRTFLVRGQEDPVGKIQVSGERNSGQLNLKIGALRKRASKEDGRDLYKLEWISTNYKRSLAAMSGYRPVRRHVPACTIASKVLPIETVA